VCHITKTYENFTYYRNRFTSDGMRLRVNTNCLSCQKTRASELRKAKKNAPSRPEFCDACGKVPPTEKNWQVDHDHISGEFCGWLCKDCNVGFGKLGDTAVSISKVFRYIIDTRSDVSDDLLIECIDFMKEHLDAN